MMTIYEPRGRAAEYSLLGLNLYRGCPGRCFYCYVPGILKMDREAFHKEAKPRPGVLDHLGKNARHYYGDRRRVLLSFTSDPYNPIEADEKVTRMALRLLRFNNVPFQILTKNSKLARRDFDLYRPELDAFAVTMTSVRDWERDKWEPATDDPIKRMDALATAHERGIFTWISLEPVIDTEQSLEVIRQTHDYCDHYKIGTLNHVDCKTTPEQWRYFANRAVDLCTAYRRTYYLKKDLRRFVDFEYHNTDERRVVSVK
jgi:DNA repair photolyase